MKIAHILPGTGGTFYCQNCMRDIDLIRALRRQGHDVIAVPVYLPLLTDVEDISAEVPVFFGGINVYLQQQFKVFRKTPRWFDKIFDSAWMLRRAAVRGGSTEASGLGPITLSMLKGEAGNQKKEVGRLIDWLVTHEKPDVVHFSNSLLIGLAKEIKHALKVPVLCTLQDEEAWLDHIDEPYDRLCWEAMSACAEHVDMFIAVSQWYADKIGGRMKVQKERMSVVPLGIDLEDREAASLSFDPPVLGYLSKMTASLGLGLLVDAFIQLKQNPELSKLRLRATGGLIGHDIGFVAGLKRKLARNGMESDVEFLNDFDRGHRRRFLQSLSVLSVPATEGEAFGMFILEALAAGVPVVQPDIGGYHEVVEATAGGILYDGKEPGALVEALASLLLDPENARRLGRRGRTVVFERFSVNQMAENIVSIYESLGHA